ncbi:hypothetical protein BAMA_15070 [Bacillus manliponensis]|uniref:Uncharacterized protein n=1 Tax=Bacillus manliponensis TaxID=574376 RepID=A0A073K074_9BACI|nr:hypothetical protein [Bacillus manliponensis]KEK20724.1 hypothetical protein BAMA_15070 [Bacillus manliponensis]
MKRPSKEICDYLNEKEQYELVECFKELENAQTSRSVHLYSNRIKELLKNIEQKLNKSLEEAAFRKK